MQIILSEFCPFFHWYFVLLLIWHSLGLNHLTKPAHQNFQNFKKIFLNYFQNVATLDVCEGLTRNFWRLFTNYLYEADVSYCEVFKYLS